MYWLIQRYDDVNNRFYWEIVLEKKAEAHLRIYKGPSFLCNELKSYLEQAQNELLVGTMQGA